MTSTLLSLAALMIFGSGPLLAAEPKQNEQEFAALLLRSFGIQIPWSAWPTLPGSNVDVNDTPIDATDGDDDITIPAGEFVAASGQSTVSAIAIDGGDDDDTILSDAELNVRAETATVGVGVGIVVVGGTVENALTTANSQARGRDGGDVFGTFDSVVLPESSALLDYAYLESSYQVQGAGDAGFLIGARSA